MNEDKSTRYHRLGRRARAASALGIGLLLILGVLSGSAVWVRDWAETAAGPKPSLVVALYVCILALATNLATIPFSFYSEFLLERRYGLSVEKPAHWLKDHAKALLVGLLFAEIGAGLVYAALRQWPGSWWVWSGVGYSLVMIVLVNLAPVLLLPLFFTFKPLERTALRDRLTALAARAGTRIRDVYEWTLSDRTRKANAALTGLGNTRRILLSDTLLAEYSDDEIEVILAHELAHHVHRDIWSSIALDVSVTFAGFFCAHLVLGGAVHMLNLQGPADPAGMPLLLLTVGALALIVRPLLNAISRSHERRADAYALDMTRNPSAFISAMRRLGQQNMAEEAPSRLVQAFFYTHPPIRERLSAAQEWLA